MKNLLFITTTNLSSNPRILKEIKLALDKGYQCTFVGFELGNWSNETEKHHLKNLNELEAKYISATKRNIKSWVLSTLIWKTAYYLSKLFPNNIKLNAFSENKRCWLLKKQIENTIPNFDLIIAHNLGALFPAYHFAKNNNIPFAFDIEDYHPGEKCSQEEKRRRALLMKELLPKAKYLTYASPLIGKYSLELIKLGVSDISIHHQDQQPHSQLQGFNEQGKSLLINNSFSQEEFQFKENGEKKLQMVWFSQNIASGRGLELIIPALAKYKNELSLTLVGNLYPDFEESFLSNYNDFITYIKPLPQVELNLFLSGFDVGLAIELTSSDFNRDICLTNKIFAYAQSGLYIMATDTSAQKQFMAEHEDIGEVTGQNTIEMGKTISSIVDNIETIRKKKKERFEYAKKLAWEHEGEKLLRIWKEVLG